MEIIFDAIPPVSCITGYYDNHHKNIGQIQQQQRSNVSHIILTFKLHNGLP